MDCAVQVHKIILSKVVHIGSAPVEQEEQCMEGEDDF